MSEKIISDCQTQCHLKHCSVCSTGAVACVGYKLFEFESILSVLNGEVVQNDEFRFNLFLNRQLFFRAAAFRRVRNQSGAALLVRLVIRLPGDCH